MISHISSSPVVDFETLGITKVPESDLHKFYEQMYPQRGEFLKDNWRWLYRIGEFGKSSEPILALSGDKIIGHLATTPVTLCQGADLRSAVWVQDLIVAPEYRRQKIASRLTRSIMSQSPLHIGFGNETTTAAYLAMGWKLLSHSQSFQLLLWPEYHPKLQEYPLASLGKTAGMAIRGLWRARTLSAASLMIDRARASNLTRFSKPVTGSALHVVRSRDFLEWRVLQHPRIHEYFVMSLGFNKNVEYRLLVRFSVKNGYRRLHLLSLSAEPSINDRLLSRCFASLIQWSLGAGIHRLLFVTSNPLMAKVARYWFPIKRTLNFLYHAKDKSGWEFLESPAHHWECLDSDLDLAT